MLPHSLAKIDPSYRKQVLDILCSFVRTETTKPDYKKLIRVTNLRNWAERRRDDPKKQDDIAWYNGEIQGLLNNKDSRIVSTLVIQTIIDLLFRKPEDRPQKGCLLYAKKRITHLSMRKTTTYFSPKDVKTYDEENYRADLSGALFWDLDMWDADFRYVDFFNANLSFVNCRGSDFRGARFLRANLNGVKFRLARFSSVVKPNDWIHKHATLLGAHSQDESFWARRDILNRHRDTKCPQERLDVEKELAIRAELVVLDDPLTKKVKVDSDGKLTVFIDGKEAATHKDVLEKVFWKFRPKKEDKDYTKNLEKYEQETGHLPADEVLKLAEDLGLYLPPT